MKPRVLIVDDEKNIRRTLAMILQADGYAVRQAESGEAALALLTEAPAELVLLDVCLPGQDGIETLRAIRAQEAAPAVIMISGQASIAQAVSATRLGAFDFLEKPLSKERVLIAVRNALQVTTLDQEVQRYSADAARRRVLVGSSPPLAALREQIAKVAPTAATVLIAGESGTGKELVARAVHEASPRVAGAFVKVNCAAIPEELIETELFGCVRGAYTGADRSRDGKFLLADGGTLFLDEIGDMSLRVQAKVLRALQEREIERVGDSRALRVDVRVIAATNKDLVAEVSAGRFREDLFYRLNVVPLLVPPLRERPDDIPRLATHFLALYATENDLPLKRLAPAALTQLQERRWPGNVRELRNLLERLAILADGTVIGAAELERWIPPESQPAAAGTPSPTGGSMDATSDGASQGLVAARRAFERRLIATCLAACGGNVTRAAQQLQIDRSNLHKKIQAYGLDPRRTGAAGPAANEEDSSP